MHSLLILLALSSAAAAEPPGSEALIRLVHQDCGSCHGLTLKGGLGSDLRPATIAHHTPETLQSIILDGIPGTPMPPWRPLISEADALWIAEYLLNGENQ